MEGVGEEEEGEEKSFVSCALTQLDRTPSAWETTVESVDQIVILEVALLDVATFPLADLTIEEKFLGCFLCWRNLSQNNNINKE